MIKGAAVVAVGPRQVRFQEVLLPEPGREDLVIQTVHSWISNGTEGSFIRGERIAGDTPWREGDPMPFPHVPGYQKVGIVQRVGEAVTGFQVGDRVFVTVSGVEGMFYSTGGHISPAVAHESQVWKIPEDLDPVAVSGLVLVQVGYNCGTRPEIRQGDAALVLGDGMVGHWAAQTLAYRGARVLMVGKHQERLSLLDNLTQIRAANLQLEDPLGMARQWAPEGVQVLVDTVGSVKSIEDLYPILRHNGHIVSAGFYGTGGQIDIQPLRNRELTLHAPAGWSRARMDATLELLRRGKLQTMRLITHRFPVQRAAEAYDLILSRQEPVLGVILDWDH